MGPTYTGYRKGTGFFRGQKDQGLEVDRHLLIGVKSRHKWNYTSTVCELCVNCMWTVCELYVSCMSAVCQLCVSCVSAVCQLYVSYVSAVCQLCVSCVSAVCQLCVSCVSAVCQLYAKCMSTVCQLYVSCMSTMCQLCVNCTSTACQLYVSCMSTHPKWRHNMDRDSSTSAALNLSAITVTLTTNMFVCCRNAYSVLRKTTKWRYWTDVLCTNYTGQSIL